MGTVTATAPYYVDAHDNDGGEEKGGGVVGSMKMTGDRYTKTLEGRSAEGIISGWGILKGLLIGDTRNRFNNILRLSMLWKVHHQWP